MRLSEKLKLGAGFSIPADACAALASEAKAIEDQLASIVREAQALSIASKHEYARAEELAARGRVTLAIVDAYLERGGGNGARSICLRIKQTWER